MPGRRFESFASAPDPPQRPADPAVRKANLRRIIPLFRPYRRRLTAVCALIVFAAGIGVISPFLLREVLDVAIPQENVGLLTALVAGDGRDPHRVRRCHGFSDIAVEERDPLAQVSRGARSTPRSV